MSLRFPIPLVLLIVCLAPPAWVFAEVQTITASHTYIMGDNDSRNDARRLCFLEAKRKVLEQAGSFIQSHAVVENMNLTKDQISSYSAAILSVEIVKEQYGVSNGQTTLSLTVKADVDVADVQKRLAAIMSDRSLQDRITAQQRQPRPVVVLDGWWNADYAKNTCKYAKSFLHGACEYDDTACQETMRIVEACVLDPVPKVRMFEVELATELAANPDCIGIQFVGWKGLGGKTLIEAVQKQHWLLGLDYIPGDQKQPWWMVRSSDHSAYMQGEGSANEIARNVCAIVNQRGATVQ